MTARRRSRPLLHACLAALAAAALPTPGQAAGAAEQPPTELETVTVYARRLTPVTQVAATVTVIDQARIEAILATDIRDIVRYEPGLSVRSDPFRFGLDTLTVRGLGGNRVAVEIDGIPAAGGFAVGSYADSGRSYLDPAFVERIELLRGPASALYGSNAIGGVAATTTIDPVRWLAATPGSHALRTEAGYDTENSAWRAAAVGAGEAGPVDWLLGYAWRDGQESATAADVTPDPSDWTDQSLLAKAVLRDMAGGPLTLTVEGGQLEQSTAVNAFLGVGRFANTTALTGDDRLQRGRVSLGQSVTASNGAFDSATWALYWQGTHTDQVTVEMRRAVPPRTPAVQLDRSFQYDESALGGEFTAVRDLHAGRWNHDLVYGVELSRRELEERRNGLQTTLATGATTPTILGETFPLRDMPLTTIVEAGTFLQDEIHADGSRWSWIPALRVDYYDLSPRADAIYREDNPSGEPVALDDWSLAPKLGVTYQFTDTLGAFFQYAHGFRSPPPEDVNIGLEIPLFRVRAVPNPDLKPETSDGYELGLRLVGSPWAVTASVFDTEYDDFIESKVNIGVDPATGVTLFQSQNVARARIYGFEFDARYDASAYAPGWSARLAGSWIRGEDLARDVPLNSVDPPSVVLGVRYDAPSAKWGSELVLTAVEAQRDVDRSVADLYRTDGYATLDLLAHVQLAPRLRLNAGLYNLTDTDYIEWADVRGRTATDPLLPYYTRAGFNASVSLRYEF